MKSTLTNRMDLSVIDQAYGPDADLYVDVLKVGSLASLDEIQIAFFDRRSELFDILSNLSQDSELDEITISQRRYAERRMDAVVLAFRILKDSRMRQQYHKIRQERLTRRVEGQRQGMAAKTGASKSVATNSKPVVANSGKIGTRSSRSVADSPNKPVAARTIPDSHQQSPARDTGADNPTKSVTKSNKPLSTSPRKAQPRVNPNIPMDEATSDGETFFTSDTVTTNYYSTDDETMDSVTEDDFSLISRENGMRERFQRRSAGKGGIMSSVTEHPVLCQCADEIQGTVSDSCNAFDQVFNVFTLKEKDINAVCARITKAKQSLSTY